MSTRAAVLSSPNEVRAVPGVPVWGHHITPEPNDEPQRTGGAPERHFECARDTGLSVAGIDPGTPRDTSLACEPPGQSS
jgi:hypothetical protein